MSSVVLIPEPISRPGLELLEGECECICPWAAGGSARVEDVRSQLPDADAVIVRLFTIDADDLARAGRLKVIAKHGVGMDNIDCGAATQKGIPVVYTPDANAVSVAEHTLTLILALARHVCPADAATRAGKFSERGRFQGTDVAGKILGIVGLGRVGSLVAEKAAAGLQMNVIGYDPVLPAEAYTGPARLADSFETLLGSADFLSFHVPLTPSTRHMVDAESIAMLKPACRIINTSRGAVIDEDALVAALERGTIAGAALDVFEDEPVPATHPLCRTPNTLLTPHIASSTTESLDRMSAHAAQGVLDVLHGKRPRWIVNPEVLP